jgi:hypothetical protein
MSLFSVSSRTHHLHHLDTTSNYRPTANACDKNEFTAPFGYELVAATWNDNAPSTLRKCFAILSPASVGTESPITISGIPVTMHDFNITPEDCGLGHLRDPGSDVQALTRHIAMGVVHSRQRRVDEQQRRNSIRLAGFGPSLPRTSAREDDDVYYTEPVPAINGDSGFYSSTRPTNTKISSTSSWMPTPSWALLPLPLLPI